MSRAGKYKAEFTVATFNLQFGQTWDARNPDGAPHDISRAIRDIEGLGADVVLLQELEKVDPGAGQIQPPPNFSRIQDALPEYHAVFAYPAPNPSELPFGYGQAILSRTPLYAIESIRLPAPEMCFEFRGETRSPTDRLLLAARTRLGDREVQLYNAHLQSLFILHCSSDDYCCQRDVVENLLRSSRLPTVLGGDMNSAPGETLVQQFTAAGFRSSQTARATWKRQPFVLDHIFYNQPIELVKAEVVPTPAADHDIVVARLRLPET